MFTSAKWQKKRVQWSQQYTISSRVSDVQQIAKARRPRPDPHQVPAIRGWDGSHYAGIYGNSQKIEKLFIMTYHYVGKTLLVYLFEGRYDPYISILIKEHVCPRSCCLKANLHETQSMIPIFLKKMVLRKWSPKSTTNQHSHTFNMWFGSPELPCSQLT